MSTIYPEDVMADGSMGPLKVPGRGIRVKIFSYETLFCKLILGKWAYFA